jgi:penicillin-binding protein 1B
MSEKKSLHKTHKKIVKKSLSKPTMSTLSNNQRLFRWCWHSVIKLSIALLFALIIYLIYLDGKVKKTFEGQRWQIPVQVYGKITTLLLNQSIDIQKLSQALTLSGYKKVAKVEHSGQFSQVKNSLIVYRRAFNFGDGIESATVIELEQQKNKISQLYQDNIAVETVQLEPSLLARIVPNNKEDRILVALENVPEKLLDTLLLVEDRNFYFHAGISPFGIIRALLANISAGHTVQGGSTLTQQLVKNMFLTRARTITRKINEAFMALIIEQRYSKDQLLEAYINEVYLGQNYANGVYGFGLASEFYFAKNIKQLSNAQMALLIAQIKGPSYYDPWRHPQRALKRRNLILRLMFEQHFINRDEFELAAESKLTIRQNRRLAKKSHPAYLQLVKQELKQHLVNLGNEIVTTSGLRIFTGFSPQSQFLLEQTVIEKLPLLEQQHKISQLEAAMMVTNIHSGEVRALVGGRNVGYAGFNRALSAKRPIGSLVKPAIYLAALERYQQYNFASVLADKPLKIKNGAGGFWQPKNYDGNYQGQVSLLNALVKSLNVPTVNLGLALGLDKVADALSLLGYQKSLVLRPSMLLGALNMSPFEVNQLYIAIAAQGFYQQQHAISAIYNANDELLWQHQNITEQRISDTGSYLLNYALRQVTEQGTARSLTWRLPDRHLAGKTGTTNNLRDSWFVGFDAQHLVTTWVGRDDNKSSKLTGSSGALVLFANFMKKQGVVEQPLIMPKAISNILFEQKTGNAVTAQCSGVVEYPAVSVGVVIQNTCLKKRDDVAEKKRSWFERLFGN